MTEKRQYIVQYVGFKTNLNEIDFIQCWAPFALNFKRAGIKTIDLYKVNGSDQLTFISRNIWEAKTYFQHFPTGVAGSGSSGGISVTQFGGYWIEESQLNKPNTMQLLFSNDYSLKALIKRKRCTDKVGYENQIELADNDIALKRIIPSEVLNCIHIKTLS